MRPRSPSILLAVLSMALLLEGAPARAHASLVGSQPSDGATIATAPEHLELWWDEPVSSRFSTVQVRDDRGQPVDAVRIQPDRPDAQTLIVDLPPLAPGTYGVLWKTLSEADGHVSRGLMVFGVGEAPRVAGGRSAIAPGAGFAIVDAGFRAAYFLALLMAVGGSVVGRFILRPTNPGPRLPRSVTGPARRRALLLAASCCLIAFGTGLGVFVARLHSLDVGWGGTWPLLTDSRWGQLWALRQVLILTGGGLGLMAWREARLAKGDDARRTVVSLTAGGMSACVVFTVVLQALSGHAAAPGGNIVTPVAADVLHVLAAGVWAGGLIGLLVALPAVWMGGRHPRVRAIALGAFRAFAPFAAAGVLVLLITGGYAVARQTPRAEALVGSPYGWVLVLKLALVAVMGGLGFWNFTLLHRRFVGRLAAALRRRPWRLRLPVRIAPRLLAAEAGVAVMIVCAVGLLTALPPPRAWDGLSAPGGDASRTASATIDDLVVTLNVKPNRPGQNVFVVRAASTRRPAPAPITRVLLRFTYLDEATGRVTAVANELERGRYVLTSDHLAMAGRWRIEVVVRRDGVEDRVAPFDWAIGAGGVGLAASAPGPTDDRAGARNLAARAGRRVRTELALRARRHCGRAPGVDKIGPAQQPQAGVYDVGVVQHAPSFGDFLERRIESQRAAVGPAGGHRFDNVGDGDDLRLEADPGALQALRIAGPVQAFVVLQGHPGHQGRIREILKEVATRLAMLLHGLEGSTRKPPGIGEDAPRYGEFSDIVE